MISYYLSKKKEIKRSKIKENIKSRSEEIFIYYMQLEFLLNLLKMPKKGYTLGKNSSKKK